jgi:hypothetical protein
MPALHALNLEDDWGVVDNYQPVINNINEDDWGYQPVHNNQIIINNNNNAVAVEPRLPAKLIECFFVVTMLRVDLCLIMYTPFFHA